MTDAKFRVGDSVIVTRVPEIAKPWGVTVGALGIIDPVGDPGSTQAVINDTLVKVRIGGWVFWWSVDDLGTLP